MFFNALHTVIISWTSINVKRTTTFEEEEEEEEEEEAAKYTVCVFVLKAGGEERSLLRVGDEKRERERREQ